MHLIRNSSTNIYWRDKGTKEWRKEWMDKHAPGSLTEPLPPWAILVYRTQIFKKEAILRRAVWGSRGWHRTHLYLYWSRSFSRKGRKCYKRSWVSDFPVHTCSPMALTCPLYSWTSCRTHFRKEVTLPSHCKGDGVGNTTEEASASVG